MKFNKQLSNGGLFLPSAALKISGFEDSGQVEIHRETKHSPSYGVRFARVLNGVTKRNFV